MFNINYKSQRPIYEQIIEQVIMFMVEDVLQANDKLPSVRELASELGINPNTVAKAYSELERRGYIETVIGKGTFISSTHQVEKDIQNHFKESIRSVFDEMIKTGYTREAIHMLVASILKEEDYAYH